MNGNFHELERATMRRRVSRKFGVGLACFALACGRWISAWADWTPPESSVTPPAVVTLDAFAAQDANGGAPSSALVAGPDGALYGSTPTGGAIGILASDGHTGGYGTLFRLATNGTFTKVHDFNGADGSAPESELTLGSDGALYGSTRFGGTNGGGTLFRLKTDGTFTKLHDFNGFDGYGPSAALVVGPDGALYGSTQAGGSYFNSSAAPYGWGTLFRLDTNGAFTKLHDFNSSDGREPSGVLAVGPDGALYGSTYYGGTGGVGTLFRLQTNGGFTKLNDFTYSNGAYPRAALVVGPDGALYGSTDSTLFRLGTDGSFTQLHKFNGSDGGDPETPLVVGSDGALYGSTRYGGTNGVGTLFRLETNGAFTKLHDFTYTNGVFLSGNWVVGLVAGPDGALYGSTEHGGINGNGPSAPFGYGTLFRLKTDGTFTKLYDFTGTNGAVPLAALAVGPDGALYGSTQSGGVRGAGTLFRLQINGTFSNLYDFGGTEGNAPWAPLVVGPDGALYGSTTGGGTNGYGYGTLFRVETNGTFTKLHDFTYTDGSEGGSAPGYPSAALVVGPDGRMYGSTVSGGTNGYGTLFRVETNGTFTKMHDFHGTDGAYVYRSEALAVGRDGALYGPTYRSLFRLDANGSFQDLHDFNNMDGFNPRAALVVGPDGNLYGSTSSGGTNGYGTLFRVETNGTFTKLHDFSGSNGAYPAALVVGPDGALYGSTYNGGSSFHIPAYSDGYGTLFRLETNGTFTKLHDFNGTNGVYPSGALVVGPDGALYGSTYSGGTNPTNNSPNYGYGTLFRLQTDGTFTKLHNFSSADGAYPGAVVVGPDGALYGPTGRGGTNDYGTLFQAKTNGTFTKLYDFSLTNGARPMVALVVGPDGALYGTTPYGGPRRGGVLFKVVLNRPPIARCRDVAVPAGANCTADASVDNGSSDPDAGDTITLRQDPPGPYPLGTNAVTLTVTDNHGASASCTATVTVVDVTPPTLSDVAVTPNVLRPPNHKMVEVTVNYTATDNCGAVSNVLSVTSNEAPNGPTDGTAPDWVIEDSHHVQLRAERSGTGTGRVYTITVTSTDNAGNSTARTIAVTVPKN